MNLTPDNQLRKRLKRRQQWQLSHHLKQTKNSIILYFYLSLNSAHIVGVLAILVIKFIGKKYKLPYKTNSACDVYYVQYSLS